MVGLALVAAATGVVGVATIVIVRAARRVPTGEPLFADCGTTTVTGFALPSLWWLPFADVRWTWVQPTAKVAVRRQGHRTHEEITPEFRDQFATIVRRIEIGEVFGVARIAIRLVQQRSGRFVPWVGALDRIQVAHGLAGGDDYEHRDGSASGDYYNMRRYGAGDPIRFVLWKVFARTRDLLVRTPEPAIAPDQRTVAYLVAADGDEPAAGAARVAVDTGALGTTWVLGADGCSAEARTRDEAMDVLATSARANAEDSGSLAAFLGKVSKGSMSRAVVFVPARPGPWMARVAAVAMGPRGEYPRVEFVVCTDGIGERPARSRLARAAFAAPMDVAPGMARHEDLVTVVDTLSQTGANVFVVDRPAGRMILGRSLKGVRT